MRTRKGFAIRTLCRVCPTSRGLRASMYASMSGSSGIRIKPSIALNLKALGLAGAGRTQLGCAPPHASTQAKSPVPGISADMAGSALSCRGSSPLLP